MSSAGTVVICALLLLFCPCPQGFAFSSPSPLPLFHTSLALNPCIYILTPYHSHLSLSISLQTQLGPAKLGSNSYVPDGLTAAQYENIRQKEAAAADSSYSKWVAKAGKFMTLDTFTAARENSKGDKFTKDPTRGHRMAKLKYGPGDEKKWDGTLN